MEPLNDQELDELLRQWQAHPAPASLDQRMAQAFRKPWWNWFLKGSIRIPVPVALAAAVVFVALWAGHASHQTAAHSEFQPVQRLVPRIIRSSL
jgi:hypothetical protein